MEKTISFMRNNFRIIIMFVRKLNYHVYIYILSYIQNPQATLYNDSIYNKILIYVSLNAKSLMHY